MKATTKIVDTRQDFTEIPLYDPIRSYTNVRILILGLGILILTVNAVLYIRLGMTVTALVVSLLTATICLSGSYYYRNFLFLNNIGTLMIAYGEIYLIAQKSIQWSVALEDCQVEQLQAQDTQSPTLRLYDQQQFEIRIQYLLPTNFWKKTPVTKNVAYRIFSKTDWKKLKEVLKHT
ncbi:MAG: hypothetical protein AAGG68_30095 [Bacteroidota bacterium]